MPGLNLTRDEAIERAGIIKQVVLEFRKNRKNTPPILFCLSLDIVGNDI